MNMKQQLSRTTSASLETWTKLAIDRVEHWWPNIERALLSEAGLGKRTATVELKPEGDAPETLMRLAAVALAERLKCEGLKATVLRPATGPQLPWETPRKQYAVEVSW